MRRRKIFRKRESGTFSLNITSMCDMFTLLLVFLLQNYATADMQVEMEKDLNLPVSSTMKDPTKAPQIIVSKDAVKIDGVIVAVLNNGAPQRQDLDAGVLKPMFEALKAKLPAEPNENTSVLLQADSRQSMAALAPYLTTISAAGFAKVKLATILGR
jgi:biopolymer transport protein ExbD